MLACVPGVLEPQRHELGLMGIVFK
jgi:hypothetical protein